MPKRDKREGASTGKESSSRKESQDLGPSDRDSRGLQRPPSQSSSDQGGRGRQDSQGSGRSQGPSGEGNEGRFEGGPESLSGSSRPERGFTFEEDEDEDEDESE